MNPWIYILIGFISFPILAIVFLLWVRKASQVAPFLIRDAEQLQNKVRELYQKGKNQDTWYVLDKSSGFMIRLIKFKRKTKEDTIRIEIRASDKNETLYPTVRELLSSEEIDFDETLTPKKRNPSRLQIKNDEGGILTVSSVSQDISKIMNSIGSKEYLMSDHDPHFWERDPIEPQT